MGTVEQAGPVCRDKFQPGVPADFVPRGFNPPGPNPLASPMGDLADLVSSRGFGPLYFPDI